MSDASVSQATAQNTENLREVAKRLTAKIGELVRVYEYRYQNGSLAFCNLRIMQTDGTKTFRMMADAGSGFELRRNESLKPEKGWPLYGLASLSREGAVWVVEGEKDVRSLARLGLPAATSGSTSTDSNADWSPLTGREVVLWPDNDEAGRKYMERVASTLAPIAAAVSLVDVSALGLAEREDCTDWLAKHSGAGAEDVLRLPQKGAVLEDAGPRVEIVRADSITPQPVDWIWKEWLAAGKLHLLGGQPGTGKTTIAMALAATITAGGMWPDGTRALGGSVVVWSGEDDPADTLVPRLRAAGADASRVHIVTGMRDATGSYPFDPARDIEPLRAKLAGIDDLRLMVVDPLVSAVSGDSHKNAEVRRGLQPLVDLAQASRCALLGVTHFSKGTGGREPIERITGSLAFGALARIVLVTAKRDDPEDETATRFLARAKSNIGPDGGGFVYNVAQVELADSAGVVASSVQWGKALDGTARELLADAEQPDDEGTSDAASFLRELLADGPMVVKEIKRQAEDSGFAWRTVQRAMKKASVESKRGGFGLPGTWFLSSRATVAPVTPTILSGAGGATDTKENEQENVLPSHFSAGEALPSRVPLPLSLNETQPGKVYF